MVGAQRGVNPRERPFLSDAILRTPKDDSSWTQVTKRANNIHTWSGIAARQSLARHKLSCSQSKLWFCWQLLSRRCPLFKYIFHPVCCLTDTSVQPGECTNTCMHVHVNVMHVWVYSICLPKSESVPLKVSLWSLRRFLSPYCQALLSCCLHGFLTVWGAMYPPVPPQHTNAPRWPSQG